MSPIVGDTGTSIDMSLLADSDSAVLNSAAVGGKNQDGDQAQGEMPMALMGIRGAEGGTEPNCIVDDNGSVRISVSQDMTNGINGRNDKYTGVGVGGGGGGEGQKGKGGMSLKPSRQVDVAVEFNNIWKVLEMQGQDIVQLHSSIADHKNIMKTMFSVMSEEQVEVVRSIYGDDASAILNEMIEWALSIREVRKFKIVGSKKDKSNEKITVQGADA